jgi:hypothetical protein
VCTSWHSQGVSCGLLLLGICCWLLLTSALLQLLLALHIPQHTSEARKLLGKSNAPLQHQAAAGGTK